MKEMVSWINSEN